MTQSPFHPAAPAADVDIGSPLVRHLLQTQHPDLADLPLVLADSGWDNMMFRLGDGLVVRLPRRAIADQLVRNEQTWLAVLGPDLPIPVPVPLRLGVPDEVYPFHWSVLPWLDGKPVDLAPLGEDQGKHLAGFLNALHRTPPADAPVNPVRGVPLTDRREAIEPRLERLIQAGLVKPQAMRLWNRSVAAEPATGLTWLHGDLHARNVLSDRGKISGIIDWGDVCSGDPATDLASVWMLLDSMAARRHARDAYQTGEDPQVWGRAAGWGLAMASLLLDMGRSGDKRHALMGARTFANLEADGLIED